MIRYIEHHIVDHCNLKCAGCSHFSGIAQPWFENIDDFIYDFTNLAELTDNYIPVIRLMGGEPLLHPQVEEFLRITRELFPTSEVQLVTNGILLKSKGEDFKKFCNDYGIKICVSNYGLNINLNEILQGYNFKRIDQKNHLYHISLDTTGSQDSQKMFNYCDLVVNKWLFYQNGRMYPCCISANIHIFNIYFGYELGKGEEDKFSIPIKNHSLKEIEDFLSRPIPLCKYCNTIRRMQSYHPFSVSKGGVGEWIYQ